MRGSGGRWGTALIVAVCLAAAACSGGGSDAGGDLDLGLGETVLQFEGAADLRLGATLALPDRAAGGPVPGVLIVPSVARNDRNGYLDVVPADFVYQDLSAAITGAGMAAFRYDRRSMGVSRLEEGQPLTFDDMVTDAREALRFLSQRREIDGSNLAIVGHDVGGVIALKVAADAEEVRSVVLLSTPGRPLVEGMADAFEASHGAESAEAFRAVIATLLTTGALPERSAIRPEHQPVLPLGQDDVLRGVYGLDPAADAARVRVPTLVVAGTQSPVVRAADVERLRAALPAAEVLSVDATGTLQLVKDALPQTFDPNSHQSHGGGRPPDTATRDQGAINQMTVFLDSKANASRQ